ncbi:MAG: ChbG/HpnK family deacetylase [Acidimicrobiia bacterium]|nr:ChbG/HpnK family deacetylase [Acidimicrobiia bacterium]
MSGRLLIVNADDFGLSPGVSRGIVAAHQDGVVTSTSMLAVAPAFELAVSLATAGDADGLGVGGHLAAVGEDPPLLSAREVPTLVGHRGGFPASWRTFLCRAAAGRVDPADLRREFTAQLDRIAGAGIVVGHLDTHQHLHLWPAVGQVVVELARERRIPAVRRPASASAGPRGRGVNHLADRLARTAAGAGVRHPARFAGLDEAGRLDLASVLAALRRLSLAGGGSAEIGCHPGEAEDPDRRRYRWGYRWADELDALRAPAARAAVEAAGFRLGTFADLAAAGHGQGHDDPAKGDAAGTRPI